MPVSVGRRVLLWAGAVGLLVVFARDTSCDFMCFRVALLPDEPLRRQALHRLAAVVRDRALLFCLVDDHVHLVARGERAEAGRLALWSRSC